MATDFSNKIIILSDLWINYRDDDDFDDFIQYNDLGLPLAYLINTELAAVTDQGRIYIEETFNLLCAALDIDLDGEYNSLIEMFNKSEEK
jgi:hypothetical protein